MKCVCVCVRRTHKNENTWGERYRWDVVAECQVSYLQERNISLHPNPTYQATRLFHKQTRVKKDENKTINNEVTH